MGSQDLNVDLSTAVKLLKGGTPVALPSETVYGLACPINSESGILKIFNFKKRPFNDPLIVHCSSLEMAMKYIAPPSPDFLKLSKTFWPGPLTLITEKNKDLVSDTITSSLNTVAIRIPRSQIFREVIELVGTPLAAPSANLFKKISPTKAEHVLQTLPNVHVLDGGACDVGIESTIYDMDSQTILRPGDITRKEIEDCLNKKVNYDERKNTPGSEDEHYQPENEVWVFEDKNKLLESKVEHTKLNLPSNSKDASRTFYNSLRLLDKKNMHIFIHFPSSNSSDEWQGLKNRLKKSSTKWIK